MAKRLFRKNFAGAPQLDSGLRHLKICHQPLCDDIWHAVSIGHPQQALRPQLQAAGDHFVVVAVANHLDHPRFQPLDLFPQQSGLPFLKTHSPVAVAAGQLHRGQHFGMALKKVWRVRQKVGDVVFGDGVFSGVHTLILVGF